MKKVGKESKRGGAREGAGRPTGQTKKKVSVSIDEKLWKQSIAQSGMKPSHLVERLLEKYLVQG